MLTTVTLTSTPLQDLLTAPQIAELVAAKGNFARYKIQIINEGANEIHIERGATASAANSATINPGSPATFTMDTLKDYEVIAVTAPNTAVKLLSIN